MLPGYHVSPTFRSLLIHLDIQFMIQRTHLWLKWLNLKKPWKKPWRINDFPHLHLLLAWCLMGISRMRDPQISQENGFTMFYHWSKNAPVSQQLYWAFAERPPEVASADLKTRSGGRSTPSSNHGCFRASSSVRDIIETYKISEIVTNHLQFFTFARFDVCSFLFRLVPIGNLASEAANHISLAWAWIRSLGSHCNKRRRRSRPAALGKPIPATSYEIEAEHYGKPRSVCNPCEK